MNRTVSRTSLSKDLLGQLPNSVATMPSNGTSPLTPLAQDALNALEKGLPSERELTYEQAYAILKEEENLERPAAEDIIERLYMNGHLYEVDGKLRLTDFEAE